MMEELKVDEAESTCVSWATEDLGVRKEDERSREGRRSISTLDIHHPRIHHPRLQRRQHIRRRDAAPVTSCIHISSIHGGRPFIAGALRLDARLQSHHVWSAALDRNLLRGQNDGQNDGD